jgi:hypothetical protein
VKTGSGTRDAAAQAQKRPHLASAFAKLASPSGPADLTAAIAGELSYAQSLGCFALSMRMGLKRCEACGIDVREGGQWEEHVAGQRHELAVAAKTAQIKQAVLARLAVLRKAKAAKAAAAKGAS